MKSRRSLRLLVEVDFLQDGGMEWRVLKPDTRKRISHKKWRRKAYGFVREFAMPTSDELLEAKYNVPFPGPLFDIIASMQNEIRRLESRSYAMAEWMKEKEN